MVLGNTKRIVGPKGSSRVIACIVCSIALLTASSFASIDAYASQWKGDVSIELKELTSPDERIHIGQTMDRQFQVSSLQDACYIRLRMDVEQIGGVSICRYVEPIEDDWVERDDGWWYLRHALSMGDRATFSSSMEICDGPSALSDRMDIIRFSETTTAEAIDARAVTPEWDSGDPWSNIVSDVEPPKDTAVIGQEDGSSTPATKGIRMMRGLARTFDDPFVLTGFLLVGASALSILLFSALMRAKRIRNACSLTADPIVISRDVVGHMEDADERK